MLGAGIWRALNSLITNMNQHRRKARALGLVASLATAAALTATGPLAHAKSALPTLLLPNMVVAEGNSGVAKFVVNVGLSEPNPLDRPVSVEVVDYSGVPLPGGGGTYGTATAGQDYVAFAPFRLTFQPGQQVARFTIKIKGDRVNEGDEEIDVRFDDTELTVGDNDIDLVLANDDATPTTTTKKPLLLLPNQAMPEPDSGCFAYRVSVLLDKPTTVKRTVDAEDYSAVPLPPPATGTYGTASPGSDYVGFGTRSLTFKPGSRTAQLPVTICGDTTPEIDEQIDVRFDNAPQIAIADNDIDLVLANED